MIFFENLQECAGKPDEAQCSFACGMLDGNENFSNLLKCMVDNGCMPQYEDDGLCLAADSDALQDLVDIDSVKGDWWVLKGQNCGQDDVWRGAYDWYPCQHGRFVKVDDGSWINNTTYCNGKDSQCTSDYIVTIPKLSMVSPGVVRHDYPEGEAPIVPQVYETLKFSRCIFESLIICIQKGRRLEVCCHTRSRLGFGDLVWIKSGIEIQRSFRSFSATEHVSHYRRSREYFTF